jgi:hypothetical protein
MVERPSVGNMCLYTHCYWRLMWDKMEIGLDHLGEPVEHSKRKGRVSDVAILRFLCGSPCQRRLRTKGVVPVSKYRTYRSRVGDIGLISLVADHQ